MPIASRARGRVAEPKLGRFLRSGFLGNPTEVTIDLLQDDFNLSHRSHSGSLIPTHFTLN